MDNTLTTDTNLAIAELIEKQIYDERVEMAEYLSDAAVGWVQDGGLLTDLDTDYFASLLGGWAEHIKGQVE